MARGDVSRARAGETSDIYYVDTGGYDVSGYCSVYIVDAERPAIVDTGLGTHYDVILDALGELGIDRTDLGVIVPTHVHLDHAGGAGYLAEACPNADVYCYEAGISHLNDPSRLWEGTKRAVGDQVQFYTEPRPIPDHRLVALADGDTVDLGDRQLRVRHAPGHAFHQAVLYDPASEGVFTADAAGINTPGLDGVHETSPPPGFDLEEVLADVEMIQELEPTALYYGHFGDRPADGHLTLYANVIQEWVDSVRRKRSEVGDDEQVVEYFRRRSDTVDAWGELKAREETEMNVRGVLLYLDDR